MLNLAVVGCGNMASDLARRSVKLGRARIAAIHDIDPEVLARRCAEFDAEPESDIHVLALAPAGKPIYCEKPLCTTVQLCDEMIAACREHGVKLFVGQVLRLFPLFWKSYEVIASGELGTPQVLSITRAGQARHHAAGWRASLVESGGLLLEVNSHELDYMLFLMGEVESVYARGRNLNGWADFDDA